MKLSIREKIGYSLGDTASHFVWDLVGFWLLFFYTDIYHIDPAITKWLMVAFGVWDAVIDPIIGLITDRTNTRWGKFRPYLLFGCVPFAILAVLAFTTPNFNEVGMIIYATITGLLLRTIYAFINLPYSSLSAVMTSDPTDRSSLNTYRFVAANIGQLIVTCLLPFIVIMFGARTAIKAPKLDILVGLIPMDSLDIDREKGYQYTVILFAALSILFFLITFFTTKERIVEKKEAGEQTSILKDFKLLFQNRPWVILSIVGIVSFVMFALQNSAIAFYFKYNMGNETQVFWFNLLGTVGLIISMSLFSQPLTRKFGDKWVYIVCSVVSGVFFCLIFIAQNVVMANVFNILAKVSYAPAVPLLWKMLADAADYGEWKFGRRTTGLCFSASVFSQKIGWAIGGFIASWILEISHFVTDETLLKAADFVQPDSALLGIRLLMSIIPGVLYASCALVMAGYNITPKMREQMTQELNNK